MTRLLPEGVHLLPLPETEAAAVPLSLSPDHGEESSARQMTTHRIFPMTF